MSKDRDRAFEQARRRAVDNNKPVLVWLTLAEVASRVGYKHVRSVKRAIDRGDLPKPVPGFGGQLCIVESELEQYMRRRMNIREQLAEKLRQRKCEALVKSRIAREAPKAA